MKARARSNMRGRMNELEHGCTHDQLYHISMILVLIWYRIGTVLVPYWYQFGINLVSIWYQLGINLVSTWYQLGINLVSTWYHIIPFMRDMCILKARYHME